MGSCQLEYDLLGPSFINLSREGEGLGLSHELTRTSNTINYCLLFQLQIQNHDLSLGEGLQSLEYCAVLSTRPSARDLTTNPRRRPGALGQFLGISPVDVLLVIQTDRCRVF